MHCPKSTCINVLPKMSQIQSVHAQAALPSAAGCRCRRCLAVARGASDPILAHPCRRAHQRPPHTEYDCQQTGGHHLAHEEGAHLAHHMTVVCAQTTSDHCCIAHRTSHTVHARKLQAYTGHCGHVVHSPPRTASARLGKGSRTMRSRQQDEYSNMRLSVRAPFGPGPPGQVDTCVGQCCAVRQCCVMCYLGRSLPRACAAAGLPAWLRPRPAVPLPQAA